MAIMSSVKFALNSYYIGKCDTAIVGVTGQGEHIELEHRGFGPGSIGDAGCGSDNSGMHCAWIIL